MASVTLDKIRKTYPNGLEAVQPCSFDVQDGEFLVLVGPSGCGKSTLLRMIAGLESITEGQLYISDRLVNEIEPAHRDIAMVFQNYALYPHMTVEKNMGYGLKNRGVPKADISQKVAEAATLLNLDDYLKSKPSELSGGQRQRVAMGRAIVRSPQLFLFDEPLSNLDAKLRNQMRMEIRTLQRNLASTAMYVTHDQVEAMTLADRIVVLNKGVIEQIGTPEEIYDEPASTFVASFMGAPPMNLLEGVVEGEQFAASGGETFAHRSTNGTQLHNNSLMKLGVRPEDVTLCDQGGVSFVIELVEELGAHRLLHGQVSNQSFSISVPKSLKASPGTVRIDWRPESQHWFSEAGKRL